MRFWLSLAFCALPMMATAQISVPAPPPATQIPQSDCQSAFTQIEMTACAASAYKDADAELNRVYKTAMTQVKTWGSTNGVSAATMLRDAQRAWLPYRDAACAAEAQLAAGGSMMGQITLDCLTRLTRTRSGDLLVFAAER